VTNVRNRNCPECKRNGILVTELYPDGTQCQFCRKHIEVDAMFAILSVAFLAVLTALDFNYWEINTIGYIAAPLLIINGIFYYFINARIMPLKHYEDDTSL